MSVKSHPPAAKFDKDAATEPMKAFSVNDWLVHFAEEEALFQGIFGAQKVPTQDAVSTPQSTANDRRSQRIRRSLHAKLEHRVDRTVGRSSDTIDDDNGSPTDIDDFLERLQSDLGKGPCFVFLQMKFPKSRRKCRVKAYVPCPKNAEWMA